MNKRLTMLWVLLLMAAAQAAFPNDSWPTCEVGDQSEICKKEISLKFDIRNLDKGVGYLKSHVAPLSVLVPWELWERGDIHWVMNMEASSFIQRMASAQSKLLQWFRNDLALGFEKPRVTWARLVKINQIVTGDNSNFQSESHPYYHRGMTSGLEMGYLSESVINEVTQSINKLREAAKIKSYRNWSYVVRSRLLIPRSPDDSTELLAIVPEAVNDMLRKRAEFLEALSKVPGIEESLKPIKSRNGGYYTAHNPELYLLDSVHLYHMAKGYHPKVNEKDYLLFEHKVNSENPAFYLLDVPDRQGKTSKDYPKTCLQCERAWLTLLPSAKLKDLGRFGTVLLVAANNFVERKAMFSAALASLNKQLRGAMKPSKLVDVLSVAWRELTLAHVFTDGNGRTIRLLMNSLLMAYSLPPLSCNPNCQPYSHKLENFKDDIRAAIELTKHPYSAEFYPQWLQAPEDQTLREWAERL